MGERAPRARIAPGDARTAQQGPAAEAMAELALRGVAALSRPGGARGIAAGIGRGVAQRARSGGMAAGTASAVVVRGLAALSGSPGGRRRGPTRRGSAQERPGRSGTQSVEGAGRALAAGAAAREATPGAEPGVTARIGPVGPDAADSSEERAGAPRSPGSQSPEPVDSRRAQHPLEPGRPPIGASDRPVVEGLAGEQAEVAVGAAESAAVGGGAEAEPREAGSGERMPQERAAEGAGAGAAAGASERGGVAAQASEGAVEGGQAEEGREQEEIAAGGAHDVGETVGAADRQADGGPEPDPLAPVAQRFTALANADAAVASAQVMGRAASRRAAIAAHFAARRGQLTGLVHTASERIGTVISGTGDRITLWLHGRVLAIHARIMAVIERVTAVVASIAAAIRSAANAVVAAVTGVVSGAVERVMDLASSIPIPDLPLIGRVRGVVLGAARRIAGVITGVVTSVGSFATRIVGFVVAGITAVASQVGAVIMVVLSQIVAGILGAIAQIAAQLAALRSRVAALLAAALSRIAGLLTIAERAAIAQVDRLERAALQRIETNRQRTIAQLAAVMAFVVGGDDYPSDEGAWGPLDQLDSAITRAVADAGALAAFAAVAQTGRTQNAVVVARFELETSNIVALVFLAVTEFVRDVAAQVAQAVSESIMAVAAAAESVVLQIQGFVSSVISQIAGFGQQIAGFMGRVLSVFGGLIGHPLESLRSVLTTVLSAVRGFVTRLIDGLISFFRRAIGSDEAATEGVTSGLDAFSPSRLAAAAGMASVPILIAAILGEAAAATLALLGPIVLWAAFIGLILLALYLLYRLVDGIVSRVRAKPIPKDRTKEKDKTKEKEKPKRRRRRRRSKPFFWNPRANSPEAIKSGGLPGAVDVRGATSTPQGHHVWPKYVGGPDKGQPLLGARQPAHQAIHSQFPLVMGPIAAALGAPLTPSTAGNARLITLLRQNDKALVQFAAGLTLFYAGFSKSQVSPAVPAAAYGPGIAASMGVIRASRRPGR
jgi:phage-related protein